MLSEQSPRPLPPGTPPPLLPSLHSLLLFLLFLILLLFLDLLPCLFRNVGIPQALPRPLILALPALHGGSSLLPAGNARVCLHPSFPLPPTPAALRNIRWPQDICPWVSWQLQLPTPRQTPLLVPPTPHTASLPVFLVQVKSTSTHFNLRITPGGVFFLPHRIFILEMKQLGLGKWGSMSKPHSPPVVESGFKIRGV